jgi:hypothetical protein
MPSGIFFGTPTHKEVNMTEDELTAEEILERQTKEEALDDQARQEEEDDEDWAVEQDDILYATLRPFSGAPIILPISVDEAGNAIPKSILDACAENNVTVGGGTQFLVDSKQVAGTTVIAPGMSIVAVGNVKGG